VSGSRAATKQRDQACFVKARRDTDMTSEGGTFQIGFLPRVPLSKPQRIDLLWGNLREKGERYV